MPFKFDDKGNIVTQGDGDKKFPVFIHADGREACAEVLSCNWIHSRTPSWDVGVVFGKRTRLVPRVKRIVEIDAGEDGEHIGLEERDQDL